MTSKFLADLPVVLSHYEPFEELPWLFFRLQERVKVAEYRHTSYSRLEMDNGLCSIYC